MKVQIKQDLTKGNCIEAIDLSGRLYNSSYSDNEVRMLYASAHACNVGIQLFQLLDDITTANLGTQDAIIRTMVRLFPSTTADSRLQSSWFAQDALISSIISGAVVAPASTITVDANNPGSTNLSDRTLDANTYLVFIGMAEVGTGLNRYGYSAGQSPSALSYAQGQLLPWTTQAAVQADGTGTACAVVSGLFNMADGISAIVGYLSGSTSSQLSNITSILTTGLGVAGNAQCMADIPGGINATVCAQAALRIRYRNACSEPGNAGLGAASYSAGVIQGINALWL
jgi:hypothetical protein